MLRYSQNIARLIAV